jgi:signal transduction histidine kinase
VAKEFSLESGETYRVQVAVDLHHDNAHLVLEGLPPIFLLFSLPLLILCSLVAFGVSSRILLPLRKIIQQAQEITSEKLDSRLDEGGAKDELQELATTFNQLFCRLEEDFELQRRFTSDAAHELKTPLAVISGHVDLLCRWGKDNPAVLEESLQTLQKESRSMSQLI